MEKPLLIIAWCCTCMLFPAAIRADGAFLATIDLASTMAAMVPEIEHIVAETKPADWETARSCLYYAFAAQHILARQGIAATLWVGTIVYDPGTSTRYGISPHAWLETATHFVDPATLPRWGEVTVIPLELVTTDASRIVPGRTQILLQRRPGDPNLLQYLADHRARFERAVNGEN